MLTYRPHDHTGDDLGLERRAVDSMPQAAPYVAVRVGSS
jgi:hypothetical protein